MILLREWYENSWSYVVKKLNTDIYRGLSEDLAHGRMMENGENKIISSKSSTLLNAFSETFRKFWFIFMILNSFLFLYIGNYLYSFGVFLIAIILLIVNVFTISNSKKRLELLKDLDSMNNKVIREGKARMLPTEKIVVGDIVVIDKGGVIPADLRIVEADNLKIKESAVTGEDFIVEKFETKIDYGIKSLAEMRNIAFKGSKVVDGSGVGVVIATGMDTAIGNIIKYFSDEAYDKDSLVKRINKVMSSFGMVVFFAGLFMMGYEFSTGKSIDYTLNIGARIFFTTFPYGIVIIYFLTYILITKKFNSRDIKVKSIDSIMHIADISMVAFDKIGSLSKTIMEVKEIYTNDKIYFPSHPELLKEYNVERIIHAIVLCNNSIYDFEKNIIKGDLSEGAFLKFAGDKEIYRGLLEADQPRIFEIPFDSQKKIMTTVNKVEGNYRAYVKGAVDAVLGSCTHIMKDGIEKELEESDIQNIKNNDMYMSGKGLNAIAVAYRNFNYEPSASENIESNLVFVGLIAVENPITEEADVLLKRCRQLNLKPLIMSDDNKLTAYSIGKKLGVSAFIERVIAGIEISNMDFEELKRVIKKVTILTKLSDENKAIVTKALKENKSRLMLTGSSFTELPALTNAYISVAVGEKCSNMLKRICDIYIKNDYLSNILKLVNYSRVFINNLKISIWYILFCMSSQLSNSILNLIWQPKNYSNYRYFVVMNMVLLPILTIVILANNTNKSYFNEVSIDSKIIIKGRGIKSIVLGAFTGLFGYMIKALIFDFNILTIMPYDVFVIAIVQLIYLYILKFKQ